MPRRKQHTIGEIIDLIGNVQFEFDEGELQIYTYDPEKGKQDFRSVHHVSIYGVYFYNKQSFDLTELRPFQINQVYNACLKVYNAVMPTIKKVELNNYHER